MAVLLDRLSREGSISLETYGHQVGGHHVLFKFEDTLCKPVIAREHFFYATAPDVVKRYIPGFFGVINVSYEKNSSGEIQVIATCKDRQPTPLPPGMIPDSKLPKCTTGHTIHKDVTLVTTTNGEEEGFMNPWATMCSKLMDRKLSEMGGGLNDISVDYMILENLTSKFHFPSVLDLKVGTRQHGDDSTPSKVVKHMHSCAISTSGTLGVRMSGLQKYDRAKKEYVFIDKYCGKQLTVEEFSQVLTFFLYNGTCFRHDLIPSIIKMLLDLRASVRDLSSFRYFSSSLLLIYDGAECPESLDEKTCLHGKAMEERLHKILSRAKSADEKEAGAGMTNGKVDSGILNGASCGSGNASHDHETLPDSEDSSRDLSAAPFERKTEGLHSMVEGVPSLSESATSWHSCNSSTRLTADELSMMRANVDLRMIDFAHSTHSGYTNDRVTYEGPDDGYLTGLDSLIAIFQNMESLVNR